MSKYTELITNYHATKPKFLAHVDLMTRPLIDVAAATRGLITAFDIDSAVGVQLDILGLWIGRSRVVSQPISGVYFSWDTDGLGYDQGVWQGPYDPDSGYMYLSDETYRVILKAKIAINNWDGRNDSLPAILDAATAGSGLRMQIVDNPVFVGSSLMFLKEGDRVSVRDLSRGLIVDSGNDACVALADYIAGGQRQFVEMMNNYAEKLHLKDTHFETVHGLDAPGQHSSAYDLAVLSRAIIHGEPEFYHMYSEKSLTWNGITQQNRNGLLWDKTMNIDGLKTGHTSGAGFNLIASAVDGQRRLIAVVMGADSAKGREEEARKLLRWGQQNFTTVQILHRGKKVGTERIWYGDKENIALGTEQEFWMVLPKAEIPHIKAKYTLDGKELTAPISAHQRVGEIELYDRDKQVAHWPLVTLESVGEGSMFSRLSDYFHHKA